MTAGSERLQYLTDALRYCDFRWEKAMARPGYRDEETIEHPFTDDECRLYWWADTWRDLYHHFEDALYREQGVRHGLLEGASHREPLLVFEAGP